MEHDEKCERVRVSSHLRAEHEMKTGEWFKLCLDFRVALCYCGTRARWPGEVVGGEYGFITLRDAAVERLNYYRKNGAPPLRWRLEERDGSWTPMQAQDMAELELKRLEGQVIEVDFLKRVRKRD